VRRTSSKDFVARQPNQRMVVEFVGRLGGTGQVELQRVARLAAQQIGPTGAQPVPCQSAQPDHAAGHAQHQICGGSTRAEFHAEAAPAGVGQPIHAHHPAHTTGNTRNKTKHMAVSGWSSLRGKSAAWIRATIVDQSSP